MPNQIEDEIIGVIELVMEIYKAFGFSDYHIELSTKPEKRIGSDEIWETATDALASALKRKGIDYQLNEGDGAFYGPKIDFHIEDCLKRFWQLGTIQLDFAMPQRFELTYTDSDNTDKTPVMIHRAILGALERFMGILIEHYGGWMPLWLAPQQVIVLPISDKTNEYAEKLVKRLVDEPLRCTADLSNEKIGAKVARAHAQKVPYMLIVGPKEAKEAAVSVRMHTADGDKKKVVSIDEFVSMVTKKVNEKQTDYDF